MIRLGNKTSTRYGRLIAYICSMDQDDLEPTGLPTIKSGNVLVVGCFDGRYEVLYVVDNLDEYKDLYRKMNRKELMRLVVYQMAADQVPK